MSDLKAKMYQIRFPLGHCPRPHWGAYRRDGERKVKEKQIEFPHLFNPTLTTAYFKRDYSLNFN